jgi:hypothetical protein
MTTQATAFGLLIETADVQTDGKRWRGKVWIAGTETIAGTWIGVDGSDFGELVDLEGDEELCRFVERQGGEIESAIVDLLGDPCDDDGRAERAEAMAIEAAIDDRMGAA